MVNIIVYCLGMCVIILILKLKFVSYVIFIVV